MWIGVWIGVWIGGFLPLDGELRAIEKRGRPILGETCELVNKLVAVVELDSRRHAVALE